MAIPIISGIVEGIKNNFGGNNQTQQNQQTAAAIISQAQQQQKQNTSSITSGEKTYTEVVRENREQSKKNQSNSNWRNSSAGVDISLGKATTEQKLEAVEQGATPENVGLESPKTSSSSGNLSKWQNPNVDWETPKDTIIENPTPAVNDGGVFNNPVDLLGTVAGIGVGAKVATTVAPKIISKVPDIAKDAGKTAAGFTIGGGLAGTGGETEFSEKTSKISGELKELSSDYIAKADSAPAKIGANIGALGLGAAAAAVDTLGALSSAQAGAIKIADQIGDVPANLWELMNGNGKASDIPETLFKPVITFGEGVKTAGHGIADWAMNAGNTPAFSLGEALGFGGVFKGTKTAVKLPETAKNALIKEAQADITGSFSEFAGLDRTATVKAFKAASNTVQLAQKVDVPLVSKTNVPLQDLTMFEDINPQTLGKLESSLANAEVVSYGTTANVLFGLDFRKTSDFDASVPEKNAVKLVNQILEDTKAYGTRPSKPITNDATSYQIERPSPQTGKYAHMFDLKKLEETYEAPYDPSTSVFARTPTRASQYLKIEPEGAKNAIKVEPLEFALSRKYAAVYFPRTDKLADTPFNFVAPKTISYKTKIDLESYKSGIVTDANQVTRNILITGAGFKVARVAGTAGGIAAKLKSRDLTALGTINTKINYPIELGDSHRMKDALDLVGMTWEYQNKLAKRGTINPIKGALVSRKFGKNLDTMLKDDYLKAQVRTGAKDKLSDLSPEFATFLKSKGILTDRQLNRVTATPKAKAVETAFLSGSPDIEKIKLQFSPLTPGAKAKSSPITPMTTPVKIPQVTTAPSPFTPQKGGTKPQKGGTKPTYSTGQSSKRYPIDSTPKPTTRNPTITGLKQTSKTSQKNVVSLYYPGDDFSNFGTESPNKKRSDDDSDRKQDKNFFRAIKTQRIDHFGIYDPLEFLGKGSMTKREQKGRALPELTTNKRLIFEVDGAYQTKKPKGRTRR